MKVLKYGDYHKSISLSSDFIDNFSMPIVKESKNEIVSTILKDLSETLKFNFGLISTFGFGVTTMYPIVENLIKNGSLKIDLTPENIVLLTLTSLSLTYLENSKNKIGDNFTKCFSCKGKECKKCDGSGKIKSKVTKKDAQNLLEELKLRGIGNGIVKSMVKCFNSISNIVRIIFKMSPYTIKNLIEMLGYTSLLIPTMNAVSALVGKYDLNMETLPGNFLSLGLGISTIIAKSGIGFLIKKLKKKININDSDFEPGVDDEYHPFDVTSTIDSHDLIKEQ